LGFAVNVAYNNRDYELSSFFFGVFPQDRRFSLQREGISSLSSSFWLFIFFYYTLLDIAEPSILILQFGIQFTESTTWLPNIISRKLLNHLDFKI
jgi:hypothetical protein